MHRSNNATTLDASTVQSVIDGAAKYELLARSFPARDIVWSEGR